MSFIFALLLGAFSPSDLAGSWVYDGYIYQGDRFPLPNPNLYLVFNFKTSSRVNLFWTRSQDGRFCEREAFYSINGDLLYQKIDWVNPDNAPDCAQDPDMQFGRESITKINLVADELHLYFNLNQEEFIYVMKKVTN